MGEADLGLVALGRDVEGDLGAVPLVAVLDEAELALQHAPGNSTAGDELGDPLPAEMKVLIAIGEFGAEPVGAAFDVTRPPGANIVDGGVGRLRALLDGEGRGEAVIAHGLVLRSRDRVTPSAFVRSESS